MRTLTGLTDPDAILDYYLALGPKVVVLKMGGSGAYQMTPDEITRRRDQGFAGLKFIAPLRPYNDRAYFPLYERAAELQRDRRHAGAAGISG